MLCPASCRTSCRTSLPGLTHHALAAVLWGLLPATSLGCALPPSTRARALPQVFVTVRQAWGPRDLTVFGAVAFPLRNVVVSTAMPVSDWVDDVTYVTDLEPPVPLFDERAWAEGEVACQRADTCLWQRTSEGRVLAAWGVAP